MLYSRRASTKDVMIYTDVDWVSVFNDKRSTSGYFTFV